MNTNYRANILSNRVILTVR